MFSITNFKRPSFFTQAEKFHFSSRRKIRKKMIFIVILSLLGSVTHAMDLTQILTMSAMSGGEEVDPLQIMLMTQLLQVLT